MLVVSQHDPLTSFAHRIVHNECTDAHCHIGGFSARIIHIPQHHMIGDNGAVACQSVLLEKCEVVNAK